MSFSWKKLLPLALLGVTLAGCGGGRYYSRNYPPPPPRGYRTAAPGPGFVWVDGYQDWRGSRYVWVPGRWMRPPRARAVWVPGHWAERGRGRVWVRGDWR